MNRLLIVLCAVSFLAGCSTVQLSTNGDKVEVVNQLDRTDCKNLGPVFGKGGDSSVPVPFADSEDKLMEYATNDVRNKAAAKRATHVVIQPHQMGQRAGATITATQQGIAYSCPN